jgi:hypothetical protein
MISDAGLYDIVFFYMQMSTVLGRRITVIKICVMWTCDL